MRQSGTQIITKNNSDFMWVCTHGCMPQLWMQPKMLGLLAVYMWDLEILVLE